MSTPGVVPVANGPIEARLRPPGSKSESIRALTAAALADGRSHLYEMLLAEDTAAMSGIARAVGAEVDDGTEPWSVDGTGGWVHTPEGPLEAGESGLSARIALALAASADGTSVVSGRGRLPERPFSPLLASLEELGVEFSGTRLPIEVTGHGRLWGGRIRVDCSQSTQFATALMMVAPTMSEPTVLELRGVAGSAGYLDMTVATMRRFGAGIEPTITGFEISNSGYAPSDVVIEPDASAAVYPLVAAAITGGTIVIEGLGSASSQPDIRLVDELEKMGCRVSWQPHQVELSGPERLGSLDTDMAHAPDGALALAVACLFADGASTIRGLGSLRHKESDRLSAISTEMRRLGATVAVEGDALLVTPEELEGATLEAHGDHRIAMSMALVGLLVPGVTIAEPSVVAKTWPGFWRMLNSLVTKSSCAGDNR